jgi:hypothetical protein
MKELFKILVVVLIALIIHEMLVKKMLHRSGHGEYEGYEGYESAEEAV